MQTISSKEVAEMLGKRHDNFMRDIRKYIDMLDEEATKYFVEGSYKDGLGKARAGYEVTLAGCELIAGRMIGEKSRAFREKIYKIFDKPAEPTPEPETKRYSVQEVAELLGMSERSVYRNIDKGALKAEKIEVLVPTLKTLITEEDLETFKTERGIA